MDTLGTFPSSFWNSVWNLTKQELNGSGSVQVPGLL